jgi:hypothetical protein
MTAGEIVHKANTITKDQSFLVNERSDNSVTQLGPPSRGCYYCFPLSLVMQPRKVFVKKRREYDDDSRRLPSCVGKRPGSFPVLRVFWRVVRR